MYGDTHHNTTFHFKDYSPLKQFKGMKKSFIHYLTMTGRYTIWIFCILIVSSSLLSARDRFSQELDTKVVYLTLQENNKPL
jgi:hypothetical protein